MAAEVLKEPHSKTAYDATQLLELLKCCDSTSGPVYFINNFMKIQHPIKGAVPFTMYPFQYDLVNAYHNHRFSIILASRQVGKTSCAAAYILWRAMFVPDTTVLICGQTYAGALEIMDRIHYAYENLPDYIRAGVKEYNKGNISFDNGSRIVSRATTTNSGRGLSISLLYVDEMAALKPSISKEFWTAILPTLSTGGSCIITSTPKSDEDQFASIYKGAIDTVDEFGNPLDNNGEGKNGFFALTIPWWHHPDRDEAWAKEYRDKLGEARFQQEMCCVDYDTQLTFREKMGIEKQMNMSVGQLYALLKMAAPQPICLADVMS